MSSDVGNLQQGACGGARALQVRCFRRVNSGTAGVKRWHPISAAEFQQEEPEKSALEKCAALSEGEPFAGGVGGEVGSELPISPPSPPRTDEAELSGPHPQP